MIAGEATASMTRKVPTVREIVEASLSASAPALKDRTVRGYRQIYDKRVLPWFGSRRVNAVTRADVQTWVTALHGAGLSPATVHHHYVALKKAFRFAQQDRLIAYNPCDGVKLPKAATVGDFAPRFLTAAEAERIAARLDATAPPYGLLVRFAAYTGLRAGELTGLRVRDLNLKAGHVEVRQTLARIGGVWKVSTPKSARSSRNCRSWSGLWCATSGSTSSPTRTALTLTRCCGRGGYRDRIWSRSIGCWIPARCCGTTYDRRSRPRDWPRCDSTTSGTRSPRSCSRRASLRTR